MRSAFIVKVRVAEDEATENVDTFLYMGDLASLATNLMDNLRGRNMTPATILSIKRLDVDDVYVDGELL